MLNRLGLVGALLSLALIAPATGLAKTSHAGWPRIDGKLIIHKNDQSGVIRGTVDKHNELLGGHGNDTIIAGNAGDVLWGDYKPSGQPTTQVDTITGGNGDDFIYASHGINMISTGQGHDIVHAHFGSGEIHCGSPQDVIFLSHQSRPHYKLFGCSHVSYQTVGH